MQAHSENICLPDLECCFVKTISGMRRRTKSMLSVTLLIVGAVTLHTMSQSESVSDGEYFFATWGLYFLFVLIQIVYRRQNDDKTQAELDQENEYDNLGLERPLRCPKCRAKLATVELKTITFSWSGSGSQNAEESYLACPKCDAVVVIASTHEWASLLALPAVAAISAGDLFPVSSGAFMLLLLLAALGIWYENRGSYLIMGKKRVMRVRGYSRWPIALIAYAAAAIAMLIWVMVSGWP